MKTAGAPRPFAVKPRTVIWAVTISTDLELLKRMCSFCAAFCCWPSPIGNAFPLAPSQASIPTGHSFPNGDEEPGLLIWAGFGVDVCEPEATELRTKTNNNAQARLMSVLHREADETIIGCASRLQRERGFRLGVAPPQGRISAEVLLDLRRRGHFGCLHGNGIVNSDNPGKTIL